MKKLLIIISLLLLGTAWLYSQGELDEQQKVFFRNERSFAILLNTDGIGFGYRGARRINFRNKNIFEADLGTLRNSKEYKQASQYIQGGSFVFGKLNTVIYLRAGVGRQHEIYSKADLGGIAVRYFYSAGPVLAVYKPIYYRVIYYVSGGEPEIREEKFDVSLAASQDIYSKAPFTRGFDEIKVMPGLYCKGGFNFEYSKEDKIIHAIEVGAQINAFPKKIPIMANTNNKTVFFSLFVSYRFGVILDPLNPESNRLSNIFKRRKKTD